MANYKELQDEVLYRARFDASAGTHRPHVKVAINNSIQFIRNLMPWQFARVQRTITTVADQEAYRLPYDWGEVSVFWHEEYGYVFRMEPILNWEFHESGADRDTTGTPDFYRLFGADAALTQPTSAAVVSVVSSSTSDTVQQVRIEGQVSSYQDSEEVNLNGTTTVNTTKSFSRIDRVVLWHDSDTQTPNEGRITVTSGATTITVLPVHFYNKQPDYWIVKLYPIPDAAYTIYADCYDRYHRLERDSDANPLGAQFDEAIILYAASKIASDSQLKTQLKGELRDEISILKAMNNRDNDRMFRMRSRDASRIDPKRDYFLRFGANYPYVPKSSR